MVQAGGILREAKSRGHFLCKGELARRKAQKNAPLWANQKASGKPMIMVIPQAKDYEIKRKEQ
jgi:hypothetical protein